MLLPVLVAVGSVVVGAAFGLLVDRARAALAPIRWIAVIAVAVVVLVHLLPEAWEAIGAFALLAFAIGLVLPLGVARVVPKVWRRAGPDGRPSDEAAGFELGYAALVIHQVGDGLALGTYGGPLHEGHDHGDVLAAIALHTIPVVALFVVAFSAHRGQRATLIRTAGLAIATLAGIAVAFLGAVPAIRTFEPWVTAVVAGLLLHVVVHDWHPHRKSA